MNENEIDMMWELARHLLNPDEIPLHKWAVKGAFLLSRLEEKYPEQYAKNMRKKEDLVSGTK